MRRRRAAIGVGLLAGLVLGCLLQLDDAVSCGDGFIDTRAGEECDPAVPPSSFQCGDSSRVTGCDPMTCKCEVCGDGIVGAGEECDDQIGPGEEVCKDGTPNVKCENCRFNRDDCPRCGNGTVEAEFGEECDPQALGVGGIGIETDCRDLPSPFPNLPFATGTTTRCLVPECRFDRSNCTFCGNGTVEGSLQELGIVTLPEACDGTAADPDALLRHCRSACTGSPLTQVTFDCNFECSTSCLGFEMLPADELDCCLPKGEFCPPAQGGDMCCWERDNPDQVMMGADPCDEIFVDGQLQRVCR